MEQYGAVKKFGSYVAVIICAFVIIIVVIALLQQSTSRNASHDDVVVAVAMVVVVCHKEFSSACVFVVFASVGNPLLHPLIVSPSRNGVPPAMFSFMHNTVATTPLQFFSHV